MGRFFMIGTSLVVRTIQIERYHIALTHYPIALTCNQLLKQLPNLLALMFFKVLSAAICHCDLKNRIMEHFTRGLD